MLASDLVDGGRSSCALVSESDPLLNKHSCRFRCKYGVVGGRSADDTDLTYVCKEGTLQPVRAGAECAEKPVEPPPTPQGCIGMTDPYRYSAFVADRDFLSPFGDKWRSDVGTTDTADACCTACFAAEGCAMWTFAPTMDNACVLHIVTTGGASNSKQLCMESGLGAIEITVDPTDGIFGVGAGQYGSTLSMRAAAMDHR